MSKEATQTRLMIMQWQNDPCEMKMERLRQFYLTQPNAQSIQQPELPMIPEAMDMTKNVP